MRVLLAAATAEDRAEIARALRIEFPQARIDAVLDREQFDAVEDFDAFALAVTEWRLGWGDGHEVVGTIKNLDPDCPVLVVINVEEPDKAEAAQRKAQRAGADRCLARFDAPALRTVARELARDTARAPSAGAPV